MRRWVLLAIVGVVAVVAIAGLAGVFLDAGGARDDEGSSSSGEQAVRQIRPSSEGRNVPEIAPPDPVPGEAIEISGRLTTELARPVILEALEGTRWRAVAEGESGPNGQFAFSIPAPESPTIFRGRAPVFETVEDGERVSHGRQTTRRNRVDPVEATAALVVAPAPVGQTPEGKAGLTPGEAQFSPPRPGREVVLQRRAGGRWDEVATATQDDRGAATFHLDLGAANATGRYRAVAVAAEGAPNVPSPPVKVTDAPLVWSDEFDGTELNFSKWDYRQLGERNPTGNRACAESDTSSVSVRDGQVGLSVREIPRRDDSFDRGADCPHGQYFNGHIGTSGKFAFRYGVLAARMRFQPGKGQHSAFWSQPTNGGSGAEIDAVEYFGDGFPTRPDPDRAVPAGSHALQHSIYWTTSNGKLKKVGGLFDLRHLLHDQADWSDGFHVYSVEWTPAEYVFRVDGHETFRTSKGVSDAEQYLILSLLTSDWELPRLDTSDRTPLLVDWVRVWDLPVS